MSPARVPRPTKQSHISTIVSSKHGTSLLHPSSSVATWPSSGPWNSQPANAPCRQPHATLPLHGRETPLLESIPPAPIATPTSCCNPTGRKTMARGNDTNGAMNSRWQSAKPATNTGKPVYRKSHTTTNKSGTLLPGWALACPQFTRTLSTMVKHSLCPSRFGLP